MNRIYEDDEFQAYKEGIALDILNVDEVRKEKDSLMSGIGNELEKLEQWKREREQRKQQKEEIDKIQEDYQNELERKAWERQEEEFLREEEALNMNNKLLSDGINKLDDIWVRKNHTNAGANIKAKKQHENIMKSLE